jgi:hypothetical protein
VVNGLKIKKTQAKGTCFLKHSVGGVEGFKHRDGNRTNLFVFQIRRSNSYLFRLKLDPRRTVTVTRRCERRK